MVIENIKVVDHKHRDGKIRLELIPPEVILGLGEVLTHGAEKYSEWSWLEVIDPVNTYYAALMRHLLAWKNGEIKDKSSGLSHMKHVLANAMFLLHYENEV